MSAKPIVLVTGGTGFVGSHIIQQLLEKDQYTVRATARQVEKLKRIFPHAGSKLQIVEVPSLIADHSEAVKGVSALIHTATPLSLGGEAPKAIFDGAYYGSVNIVEAAIKAGVKKIIVTGSIVNLVDDEFKAAFGPTPLTAHNFGPATLENTDFEKAEPNSMYLRGKTASEKRIWEIAHEHPDIDFTVLLPPVILGPFVPNFPIPKDQASLGTIGYLTPFLENKYPNFFMGHMIDVRDVAKAHVLSLSIPPARNQDKRFLILGKIFTWKEVADVVRRERPDLAYRLPAADTTHVAQTNASYDTSLTEQLLGFTANQYIPFDKTILDSFDQLLKWEKQNLTN